MKHSISYLKERKTGDVKLKNTVSSLAAPHFYIPQLNALLNDVSPQKAAAAGIQLRAAVGLSLS